MRILWLKTELLHPIDKGGRIRTYHMLRALAREHEITYLTLDDGTAAPDAVERASEYCQVLERVTFRPPAKGSARFYSALAGNLMTPLPYAIARYQSPAFTTRLDALLRTNRFDVLVCDFLFPAVNLRWPLPLPSVLFQHNVEAEIWRRHAAVARRPWTARYFSNQWRRMVAYEAQACRAFDRVAAVSDEDATHFQQAYGVADHHPIPTGVDLDYFSPLAGGRRDRAHLVFTGSMDWMPNEDAMVFFVEDVMPHLRPLVRGLHLTVVGRKPSARVRALSQQHADVTVTGEVPDVRPYLARATAAVVPLRVGGGTRLKIYESMAMGCPIISTTIGAEGLPVQDGVHLRLADSADAFAAACAHVMATPDDAAQLAGTALAFVRNHASWSHAAAAFIASCQTAIEAWGGRHEARA